MDVKGDLSVSEKVIIIIRKSIFIRKIKYRLGDHS